MNWDGINRRKFPRVNYPCLVIVRNEDKQDIILSHTENVGIGGICVTLKRHLKMFSPVEIEVDLLDLGNHIKCEGKVVWSIRRKEDDKKKPLFYDIGIEFSNINTNDQQRIDGIVARLAKLVD